MRVAVGATDGEVLAAAEAVEAEMGRRQEAEVVDRLREAAMAGRRGVGGLGDTLAALNDHRVEHLLVSKHYAEEGWRCPDTGHLALKGPTTR